MCPARDDSFVEHTEYCNWLRGRLPNWQSWKELEDTCLLYSEELGIPSLANKGGSGLWELP